MKRVGLNPCPFIFKFYIMFLIRDKQMIVYVKPNNNTNAFRAGIYGEYFGLDYRKIGSQIGDTLVRRLTEKLDEKLDKDE